MSLDVLEVGFDPVQDGPDVAGIVLSNEKFRKERRAAQPVGTAHPRRSGGHAGHLLVTAYLALLRGVNVSGHRRIKMAELEQVFCRLGHLAVATYIQSGNVIFASPSDSPSDLVAGIEQRLAIELGLNVKVLIRSRDELGTVIRGNPFLAIGKDPTKLHVTFLASLPSRSLGAGSDPHAISPDEFRLEGRHVYLHCPLGYGRTKLNNRVWERWLEVGATTRNWGTVTKLMELLEGLN